MPSQIKMAPFKLLYEALEMIVVETKLWTMMGVYFQPGYKAEGIVDIISAGLNTSTRSSHTCGRPELRD